jgi:hypothetical protein
VPVINVAVILNRSLPICAVAFPVVRFFRRCLLLSSRRDLLLPVSLHTINTQTGRARTYAIESKPEGHPHTPSTTKLEGHAHTHQTSNPNWKGTRAIKATPKASPLGRSDQSVAFIFLKNSPEIACQAPKPLKRNALNHIAIASFPYQSGTINTGSKIRDKLHPKLFLI